jgi:ubiquinone/menaquinone biosynthesis C-methylase UbiE
MSRESSSRINLVGTENERVREAWVQEKLRQLGPGSRLLDAGAGEQRFRPSCAHLTYVAHDFAKYDGKGDSAGLQTKSWRQDNLDIVSDITSIPEPDGSFDAILCTEVLEHVPNPIAALTELARLLRPGGSLILTAPFCSLTHFAPYHFYSGFNRYFFSHHLEQLGFEIIEVKANGNFFEYLAQEVHRLPSVASRYGGGRLSFPERIAMRIMLRALARFSSGGASSAELLNYGFHVVAMKSA